MSAIKEKFNQISPSEFFYSNRDLAGFSNPTRSLYTAVREFVENALDACDHKGILPDVRLTIKALDPEKQDPKPYILTVTDNGPGVDADHIPLAFGTVLYGSKFGLKQARGMFGLGATMAILYGQITTNRPVTVKSSIDGKTQDVFNLLLDIKKNRPVIQTHTTEKTDRTGLSVSICLEGDYSKAGNKIRDYVYETSLITPYASITFDDPKDKMFEHPRFVTDIPPPPTIIRPHPHGIDVERIRRMIADSQHEIPTMDNDTVNRVKRDVGMSDGTLKEILKKASKKWKGMSRQTKLVISIMSFLNVDFDGVARISIEDIDIANRTIHYWDFGDSQAKTVIVQDTENQYYKHLLDTVQGEPLVAFLTKRFQRIGNTTAKKFAAFAGFEKNKMMGMMTNQELVNLSDSLQKFEDFMAPDSGCLAPLGESPLEKGMQKFFNPDFLAVTQRPASAYSGFPFIVEMGIAYGGDIKTGGPHIYRYANRIPLLYDEGSDVVVKVIRDTDWSRYKIKGEPPFVIVSHICSTRIPYKTAGKENVADRPEIERELRLGLQYLSRKLASHMTKRGQADMARKRANLYAKYLPLIAEFVTELAGKKKEPNYKKLLKGFDSQKDDLALSINKSKQQKKESDE